jgi:D-aminopeptidase
LPPGQRNSIADVPGVTVGHATIVESEVLTGVTAVLPHDGDLFTDRPGAAAYVLNGFGKSVGLMQVNELGCLETPILLTNTFGVGTCANALIRRAVRDNPEIGRQTSTVNPMVLECNDGYLSDIQAMAGTEAHAEAAIEAAGEDFETGAVGAGTGMSCFGLKGGGWGNLAFGRARARQLRSVRRFAATGRMPDRSGSVPGARRSRRASAAALR